MHLRRDAGAGGDAARRQAVVGCIGAGQADSGQGDDFVVADIFIGKCAAGVARADHVTIDPNIYCGECEYCRNGKKQMCRHMEAVGVTMNGGFEEYSIVPAAQALLLDPNVPLEYGAMSEPLACCLHGIDRAEIKVGDIMTKTVISIGPDDTVEKAAVLMLRHSVGGFRWIAWNTVPDAGHAYIAGRDITN